MPPPEPSGSGYLAFADRDLVLSAALNGKASRKSEVYDSSFSSWYDKSGVRSRPHHELNGKAEVYFSPELVPAASHPLVVACGDDAFHQVLVRRLYNYLHFTTELEQVAVMPVISQIARGKAGFALPPLMRRDAYKILTDEAWHAQFSDDLMCQVQRATGIAPGSLAPPSFIARIAEIGRALPPELRGVESLLFAIISETLITATLVALPRDSRLPQAVRDVVLDHAVDEGRHHVYFAKLLTYLWPRLDKRHAEVIGVHIPAMIEAFLIPDRHAVEHEISTIGLSAAQIAEVVEESMDKDQMRSQMSKAAQTTVRYFEQVGALDTGQVRAAFDEAGLLASASGSGGSAPSSRPRESSAVERMVTIWSQVLGRRVGANDHLFHDLGATSVQLLELLERIGDDLDAYLSVEQLFEHPTPAGAAAAIAAGP